MGITDRLSFDDAREWVDVSLGAMDHGEFLDFMAGQLVVLEDRIIELGHMLSDERRRHNELIDEWNELTLGS